MTKTQDRVVEVLENMKSMAIASEDDAQMFSEQLERMLNCLLGEDAFGTEGQSDPRGDMRDGEWHMGMVQGVD